MPKKRCFVISPIGAPGTEVRKHADDLFEYIIQPAMAECDIDAFRADQVFTTGKISEHMWESILKEDFAIAVLTGHNPNVFYELAVAQAAARPVIMMIEKGELIPFDIRDLRCVKYDFQPRPLMEQDYVRTLVGYVRELERTEWRASCIFGDRSPLGAEPVRTEDYEFHEKSDLFGSPDRWLEVLRETEKSFRVMGISLGSWKRGKGFTDALLAKAAESCSIRILLMHQDNPVLRGLVNEAIPEVDAKNVVLEIESMFEFFSDVARRSENIEVRQIVRGCPHFQLTLTEQRALCIQYLFSQKSGWSPMWECKPESALYKVMAEEFDLLWQVNGSRER